jgi:hypothetical protein
MTRVDTQPEDTTTNATSSRRALLASLIAGASVAAVPLLSGKASAATGSTPTTTAPPNRDDRDNPTLNALLARERSMVRAYKVAVSNNISDDEKNVLLYFHANHIAYVDALNGFLGPDADPDTSSAAVTPTGSFRDIAAQLIAAERQTADTHTASLANIRGISAASLVASIVPVEARHITVLSIASGQSLNAALTN